MIGDQLEPWAHGPQIWFLKYLRKYLGGEREEMRKMGEQKL